MKGNCVCGWWLAVARCLLAEGLVTVALFGLQDRTHELACVAVITMANDRN